MGNPETYSATDLARWGLLEAARREATRDQLMVAIPEPSEAVLAVLRQQQGAARVASHFLAPGVQRWRPDR
jgi:hypothetical protein